MCDATIVLTAWYGEADKTRRAMQEKRESRKRKTTYSKLIPHKGANSP